MDGAWIAVLADKDYLFPASWPLYAWAMHLAYAGGILAIHAARLRDRTAVAGERALVAGLMALVAIFLVSVPLTMSRVALAVQLQVNRVFWVLDVFLAIALVWWLAGLLDRRAGVRARTVLARAPRDGCGRQRRSTSFVSKPHDRSSPGTCRSRLGRMRSPGSASSPPTGTFCPTRTTSGSTASACVSRRFKDTPLDTSKDSAMAMYDRELAHRVAERLTRAGAVRHVHGDRGSGARHGVRLRRLHRPGRSRTSGGPSSFETMSSSSTTSADATQATPDSLERLGIRPFVPRRGLRHGHVMTVYAWARRRTFPNLPAPEARLVAITPDTQVLADCYWQPARADKPDARRAPRTRRVERGALHARPRGQGLAARLERGPSEPAQLRRHGASDARALSLGPHGRSACGDPRTLGRGRGSRRSPWPATRSVETWR